MLDRLGSRVSCRRAWALAPRCRRRHWKRRACSPLAGVGPICEGKWRQRVSCSTSQVRSHRHADLRFVQERFSASSHRGQPSCRRRLKGLLDALRGGESDAHPAWPYACARMLTATAPACSWRMQTLCVGVCWVLSPVGCGCLFVCLLDV